MIDLADLCGDPLAIASRYRHRIHNCKVNGGGVAESLFYIGVNDKTRGSGLFGPITLEVTNCHFMNLGLPCISDAGRRY
jgi:hypothetical protein